MTSFSDSERRTMMVLRGWEDKKKGNPKRGQWTEGRTGEPLDAISYNHDYIWPNQKSGCRNDVTQPWENLWESGWKSMVKWEVLWKRIDGNLWTMENLWKISMGKSMKHGKSVDFQLKQFHHSFPYRLSEFSIAKNPWRLFHFFYSFYNRCPI